METQLDRIERKLDELLAKKKRKPRKNEIDATILDEFDRWWVVYPKKKGKQDALKAFTVAVKSLGATYMTAFTDRIIEDVQNRIRQDESWMNGKIQYLPHPATYLRGERWLDEITKPEVEYKQPDVFSQSFKTFDPSEDTTAGFDTQDPYADIRGENS